MRFKKNREHRLPQFPFVEDLRKTTERIVTAHEIIRKALPQYFDLKDTDLSIYLNHVVEGDKNTKTNMVKKLEPTLKFSCSFGSNTTRLCAKTTQLVNSRKVIGSV